MKRVTPEEAKNYIKLRIEQASKATAFTLIPDGKGWDDVVYLADPVVDPSLALRPREYVYVLVNHSIPGMVKIGMTTLTPEERAQQISSATGVPTPWVPIYSFKCYRSDLLETDVHERLAAFRVNDNREMFAVTSEQAQQVIEELGYKYSSAMWDSSGK
jgi:hypothetical protein